MIYKSDLGVMAYGANAGPHALTSAGGYTYQYDANGNMVVGKNKTLAYDAENRLIRVNESGIINTFSYDGDGGRVRKTRDVGSGTLTFTPTLVRSLKLIRTGRRGSHIFAGANRVSTVTKDAGSGTTDAVYYHSDHLGSSSVITDSNGLQVEHYDIHLMVPPQFPTSHVPRPTSIINSPAKELDSTGLYYYGARYYDPEIGRFITPDTIVQAPYDPQTLNRYSYCRNNPINYIDPSGHIFWFAAIAFVAACAAIGAVTSVAIAGASGQLTSWTAFWAAMGSGAVAWCCRRNRIIYSGAGTILGGILIGMVAGGAGAAAEVL